MQGAGGGTSGPTKREGTFQKKGFPGSEDVREGVDKIFGAIGEAGRKVPSGIGGELERTVADGVSNSESDLGAAAEPFGRSHLGRGGMVVEPESTLRGSIGSSGPKMASASK